jgi:hypothetical protein
MSDEFHPARLRSTVATLLDALFAAAVVAVLLSAVLNLLSSDARQDLARAYARQFALKAESDCPTAFGNAFWFTCASEVRRINAVPAPAAAVRPAVAPRPSNP